MLFAYKYVPHRIEGFQEYLDHLVKEVWCKAKGDYSLSFLQNDFREIVEALHYDDAITSDWLDGPIKTIYAIFRDELTPAQRTQFARWYDDNNDIAALCRADKTRQPVSYSEIQDLHEGLSKELKSFCQSLFSNVIHLKVVQDKIGTIDEHYQAFVQENKQGKCPYCGYNDIKGQHHSKREAYDHFLPKGVYPFNSVNFRNLAPMCHECNSTYKLAKVPTMHIDPIKTPASQRRKAFYSFDGDRPQINLSLRLKNAKIQTLSPDDIELEFTADDRSEELDSWSETFGIQERYKAKCCATNDGKAWLQHIVEECLNPDETPERLLSQVYRAAKRTPWSDSNFLKAPFLKACTDAGMI